MTVYRGFLQLNWIFQKTNFISFSYIPRPSNWQSMSEIDFLTVATFFDFLWFLLTFTLKKFRSLHSIFARLQYRWKNIYDGSIFICYSWFFYPSLVIHDSQVLNTKIHDSYQFYSYNSWLMIPLPPPRETLSEKKKSTKLHKPIPKGSMGRRIELLHVLNTNEI